ncbi:MAG: BTAD domain-containing putative transcriptional regulator [Gemmatimonadota bacterium]
MLRLNTFGGLWMDGSALGAQLGAGPRRRLALLAILAAAGPRGLSRDRLLLLLWPDSTEANARHALSQLLYMLRRDAGEEIVTGATELRLDPALMSSDLADFETALSAGEPERAAELYKGPFADGFYLENGDEFERWAAEARGALARRALGAFEAAARRAEEGGNRTAAVEYRRRLTEQEPVSAPYALAYMEALAKAGDRGAALKFAKEYESIVRRELKTPAEPTIRALAQRLAAELQHSSAVDRQAASANEPPPIPPGTEPGESVVPTALASPAVSPAPILPARRRPLARSLPWLALAAAVLVAAAFALRTRPNEPALESDLVAVARFENRTGDPKLDVVGDMAADWISHGITETELGRVVDPGSVVLARAEGSDAAGGVATRPTQDVKQARAFAEGFGAGKVVWGSFYRTGDTLKFLVRVSRTSDGQVLSAIDPVTGPARDPLIAINAVRQQVLGTLLGLGSQAQAALPPTGRAPAYDAYVAFLQGVYFHTRYETDRALEQFRQAAIIDSNFLAPKLWIVETYESVMQYREADSVLDVLEPYRNRLTHYERAFFDNYRASLNGDTGGALEMSREMARIAPGPLSFLLLGEDALNADRPREALAAFAKIDVGQSFLKKWDNYWSWPMRGHHVLGENTEALEMSRKGRQAFPGAPVPVLTEAIVLSAMGRVAEARHAIEQGQALPEFDYVSHLSFFSNVCKELAARGDSAAVTIANAGLVLPLPDHLTANQTKAKIGCLACAGRWRELAEMTRRLYEADPSDQTSLGIAGIAAAHLNDRPEAERIDRLLAAITDRYSFGHPDFYRARIAAQLGQYDRAVGLLQQAFARGLSHLDATESHAVEFVPLRGRADFQELMQPRG